MSFTEQSSVFEPPSQPGDFKSKLFYNAAKSDTPINEKWFIHINAGDDGQRKQNFQSDIREGVIHDIRGREKETDINITGFQALTSASTVDASLLLSGDDDIIRRIYYPEVEALLKKATGADRIVFFDHTVRKIRGDIPDNDPQQRQPVQRVHVDQTPESAKKRVDRHVVPPQPYKRFQLINVWRPIENTVYDFPLAVADYRTINVDTDLVPTTLVYPRPLPDGETYSVAYNPAHRWYHWSHMTPDEVLLLKCFDSSSRGLSHIPGFQHNDELLDVAGLTPHTAVFHEEGAKKGIKRQSIEVRALVFYD